MGERKIKYKETMIVSDKKNDMLAYIDMEPDDRSFFGKVFSKKTSYPDQFKGIITRISNNTKYNKDTKKYTIKDMEKHIISQIEGEFSTYIKFGNDVYWEYSKYQCPAIKRMKNTLPSDSTFREDIIYLKLKDEAMSQKTKVLMEEIQRNDNKLREKQYK